MRDYRIGHSTDVDTQLEVNFDSGKEWVDVRFTREYSVYWNDDIEDDDYNCIEVRRGEDAVDEKDFVELEALKDSDQRAVEVAIENWLGQHDVDDRGGF